MVEGRIDVLIRGGIVRRGRYRNIWPVDMKKKASCSAVVAGVVGIEVCVRWRRHILAAAYHPSNWGSEGKEDLQKSGFGIGREHIDSEQYVED